MGVDLHNEFGQTLSLNISGWSTVRKTAQKYGWKPSGTEAPSDWAGDDWDGGYTSNDYQCVTAADASSMADALDLFLLDPDAVLPSTEDSLSPQHREVIERVMALLGQELDGRKWIESIVAFLWKGSFRIG